MGLLCLPTELLLVVIEDVTPDNIVNFVVSCKHIYHLCQR